ncbi:unnamed protein product [Mesocestoides corti]|uniref:Uncharacterized protein n=2 Tax=Mesocestoides corti TaxID=53468 RepID=A0A0R3UP81_MESCO|nr:unnamed protein product [Mesocestoides corti]
MGYPLQWLTNEVDGWGASSIVREGSGDPSVSTDAEEATSMPWPITPLSGQLFSELAQHACHMTRGEEAGTSMEVFLPPQTPDATGKRGSARHSSATDFSSKVTGMDLEFVIELTDNEDRNCPMVEVEVRRTKRPIEEQLKYCKSANCCVH